MMRLLETDDATNVVELVVVPSARVTPGRVADPVWKSPVTLVPATAPIVTLCGNAGVTSKTVIRMIDRMNRQNSIPNTN